MFTKYFAIYKDSELGTESEKMPIPKAFLFALFDSIFFGMKWAIFVGFLWAFFNTFAAKYFIQLANDVCPLLK